MGKMIEKQTDIIVVGAGYAKLRAQVEGVLFDPVYSGKAFAGLLDLVGNGRFSANDQLVFYTLAGYQGCGRTQQRYCVTRIESRFTHHASLVIVFKESCLNKTQRLL